MIRDLSSTLVFESFKTIPVVRSWMQTSGLNLLRIEVRQDPKNRTYFTATYIYTERGSVPIKLEQGRPDTRKRRGR